MPTKENTLNSLRENSATINQALIRTMIDAFDNNDTETIIGNMTDSAEWHVLGVASYYGKTDLEKHFSSNEMKVLNSTKRHVIVSGDRAVVDGEVQCRDKDGQTLDLYYCDVYELENGKVKKIFTYGVDKKK